MEEKKLTDDEIVKALENCLNGDYKTKCNGCHYDKSKVYCQDMDRDVLDLIHRLKEENAEQKAEIERLKEKGSRAFQYSINEYCRGFEDGKKQAVKETAKEIFVSLYNMEEMEFGVIKWFAKEFYDVEVE